MKNYRGRASDINLKTTTRSLTVDDFTMMTFCNDEIAVDFYAKNEYFNVRQPEMTCLCFV